MDSSVEESKDLKEHMVGILFSQSKLTHLQKQVIIILKRDKVTKQVLLVIICDVFFLRPGLHSHSRSHPKGGNHNARRMGKDSLQKRYNVQ